MDAHQLEQLSQHMFAVEELQHPLILVQPVPMDILKMQTKTLELLCEVMVLE